MAEWVAAGAAVVGAVSGVSAANKAGKAGDRQEAKIGRATDEKVRRIEKTRDEFVGQLYTSVAGSNVDVGSRSVLEIRNDSLTEFEFDKAVTREAGADAASYADAQADAAKWQAYGQAASSIGQLAAIGVDAGWWGGKTTGAG